MFLGHYGVALAAKRAVPSTSLGAGAFAAQWLDQLWPILLLLGVEHVRVAPGGMAANPLEFVHYPISHSLLTAVLWGALLGGLYFALRRSARGAWLLAALVVSHWLLDVPMHRPDLPLWPGSSPRVGLGLWHSVLATVLVELALFAGGIVVYLRTTRARDRIGSWGLFVVLALLAAIFLSGLTGGSPPSDRAVALFTLGLWLFAPLFHWVDRHREPRHTAHHRATATGSLSAPAVS